MVLEVFGAFKPADGSDPDPLSLPWNEGESPSPAPRKPRVLVVDDEKRIADTICEILNASGFEAVAACDGWSALEAAARFLPDYLLTDVLMPRMNGAELAIAMRQAHPAARVLLFSGHAGISEILESARQRGYSFDLLAKPIHPLLLIERLKQL